MKKVYDWKFRNIADTFDSHVREQLPWYDLVIDSIAFMVKNFVPQDGLIYDIGGSTGNIKKLLSSTITERNLKYYTIDNVPQMKPDIVANATKYDYDMFDCVILNLTMMFIPVKERKEFLNNLICNLNVGGCIIIVDKFIQNESYLSTVFRRMTLYWKYNNGVKCSNIIEKELSLSGIQIPLYEKDMGKLNAQKFFQFGEFSGYIITK